MCMEHLKQSDPDIYNAVCAEIERQEHGLEMIASENFTSLAVQEAVGTPLTNKYAEGYPGKRYYGGCEKVDVVEEIARARAKELFGAEHVNVQPHSGSQANFAVFLALLKPGETFMGQSLSDGGHLTHGSSVNFSGLIYNAVPYGLNRETERLDMDTVRDLALKHRPKMILCGYSAYPRQLDFAAFRSIADEVGAHLVADIAHIAGLVAAGEHPSPVPYCDVVTTTTHKTLRGPRSGMILCREVHAKAIDKAVFPGSQGGPLMHVIAGKAVCFAEALKPEFKTYQQQVVKNAKALAESLLEQGFRLVTGGTDNHLILIDLTDKDVTGKEAELALGQVDITVNKNTIPNETRSPFVTSGIRIGTPALTTRGMKEAEMKEIGGLIAEAITKRGNEAALTEIRSTVIGLSKKFPLYPELP